MKTETRILNGADLIDEYNALLARRKALEAELSSVTSRIHDLAGSLELKLAVCPIEHRGMVYYLKHVPDAGDVITACVPRSAANIKA